jgi:hypothetical protein
MRTGVTRSVFKSGGLTVGYAFLKLPVTPEGPMKRNEHRPWAQIQLTTTLSQAWSATQRVRYDARFRQHVSDGELAHGYGFNHRVRFLISLRRNLGKPGSQEIQPYIVASNECLLNFGREITYNTFDQNRLSVSFGIQKKQVQYQLGFMNRFVQSGPSRYTANQTVVLWVIQRFDLTKLLSLHTESINSE